MEEFRFHHPTPGDPPPPLTPGTRTHMCMPTDVHILKNKISLKKRKEKEAVADRLSGVV